MRISTTADAIRQAVETAASALPKRATLPHHRALVLLAREGQLAVQARSDTASLSAFAAADEAEDGSLAVDAGYLSDILRRASADDAVDVELAEDGAVLTVGGVEYRMSVLPEADLPAPVDLPDLPAPQATAPLRAALEAVRPAALDDGSRPYLSGVLLQAEGETLRAVATDGHRLAVAAAEAPSGWTEALVPTGALPALLRLLSAEEASLAHDDRWLYVRTAAAEAALRLGETEAFPPWRRVLPQEHRLTVRVDTVALRDSLRRILPALAGEQAPIVAVALDEDGLCLEASGQRGQAEAAMEAVVTGAPLRIGLNASYLLDALRPITSEEAVLRLGGELDAVVVQCADGDGPMSVVMPARL